MNESRTYDLKEQPLVLEHCLAALEYALQIELRDYTRCMGYNWTNSAKKHESAASELKALMQRAQEAPVSLADLKRCKVLVGEYVKHVATRRFWAGVFRDDVFVEPHTSEMLPFQDTYMHLMTMVLGDGVARPPMDPMEITHNEYSNVLLSYWDALAEAKKGSSTLGELADALAGLPEALCLHVPGNIDARPTYEDDGTAFELKLVHDKNQGIVTVQRRTAGTQDEFYPMFSVPARYCLKFASTNVSYGGGETRIVAYVPEDTWVDKKGAKAPVVDFRFTPYYMDLDGEWRKLPERRLLS